MPDAGLNGKRFESREDFDFKKAFDRQRQFSHGMDTKWRMQPQINAEEIKKKFEEGMQRFPWRKEGADSSVQISEEEDEADRRVSIMGWCMNYVAHQL